MNFIDEQRLSRSNFTGTAKAGSQRPITHSEDTCLFQNCGRPAILTEEEFGDVKVCPACGAFFHRPCLAEWFEDHFCCPNEENCNYRKGIDTFIDAGSAPSDATSLVDWTLAEFDREQDFCSNSVGEVLRSPSNNTWKLEKMGQTFTPKKRTWVCAMLQLKNYILIVLRDGHLSAITSDGNQKLWSVCLKRDGGSLSSVYSAEVDERRQYLYLSLRSKIDQSTRIYWLNLDRLEQCAVARPNEPVISNFLFGDREWSFYGLTVDSHFDVMYGCDPSRWREKIGVWHIDAMVRDPRAKPNLIICKPEGRKSFYPTRCCVYRLNSDPNRSALFVTDRWNNVVYQYNVEHAADRSMTAEFLGIVFAKGENPSSCLGPFSVLVDKDGFFYLGDVRNKRFLVSMRHDKQNLVQKIGSKFWSMAVIDVEPQSPGETKSKTIMVGLDNGQVIFFKLSVQEEPHVL